MYVLLSFLLLLPILCRAAFYCRIIAHLPHYRTLCFVFHEKQEIRRRQFPAIDVWFSRCCRVEMVDGATVVAMAIAVQTTELNNTGVET